jgi:hypothetical protein
MHQLQQRDTAAGIQNCHWFRRFVREVDHVKLTLRSKLKFL